GSEADARMSRECVAPPEAQAQPPLPGITEGVIRRDDPVAGHLFVQGQIANGAGAARFDDVHGAGWRLVSIDPVAGDLPDDLVSWFASIGGEAVAVDRSADVDATYAGWFADHGVAAVLQRPDFHLF